MSYLAFRDNKDLAGVCETAQHALEELSEHIDESSSRGLHADNCSQFCDKGETCPYWHPHMASSEETLGWLVGQGLLDPNAVVRWLAERKPMRIGIPDPEMATFAVKALAGMKPGAEERAKLGVFAQGDLVGAVVAGGPLRLIHLLGTWLTADGDKVTIADDKGGLYEVKASAVRHARLLSNEVCELYGAAPKTILEDAR